MDEREAIERLKQGDVAALETLVRHYQLRALRAAYLVTRDQTLANDVVQTAFVRLYERAASFDSSRPFGPWFLKSGLTDAIKAANRRRREVPLDGEMSPVAEPRDRSDGPEAWFERAETADEVWRARGQLPPAQRAAIVQRYYLGLSELEMAQSLDCPPSTVKWRLHAARNRLRSLLSPALHDAETTL